MYKTQKSTGLAYVLWFLFGIFGVHKFYIGKTGMGIAYIFTLGFLGIGTLIDLFTLPSQVDKANHEIHNNNKALSN
jgi:TM2 domain-containing membrane protein YozV